MTEIRMMPVQANPKNREPAQVCEAVYMRAYEVYSAVYGPQEAMITGHCRSGFSVGELVAFLYARTFHKVDWRMRVDEALHKMNLD
jgi:hypothetical protein